MRDIGGVFCTQIVPALRVLGCAEAVIVLQQ